MGWQLYWDMVGGSERYYFSLYGYDKAQSKNGGWRVPELVLHVLALAGGFPGGWLGKVVFRHKTKKSNIVCVLAVSTALHPGLVYWLFIR